MIGVNWAVLHYQMAEEIDIYPLLFAWAAMGRNTRGAVFQRASVLAGAASWVYEVFPQVFTMDTVMGIFLTIYCGSQGVPLDKHFGAQKAVAVALLCDTACRVSWLR